MRLPRASVTLFLLGSLLALDAPGTALAAAGDPDGTFGDGGKVTTPFVFGQDVARDVVVQPDGKVVVVGDAYNGADSDLGVARYLADGSPDTTFSGDGRATIHFVGQDSANGVALQPDGKIVVVGRTGVGDFGVVRLNTNGSLDSSFSGDGKVGTPGLGAAQDVAVVGGKIVVVGGASPSPGDFVVARYTSTGSPDTTFSQDGIATTDFAGSDVAYGLAVQPDGRIVVAGVTSVNMNFALARYTTTGGLDSTFSNDGKVTTSLLGQDGARAVALQADGKIVAAGFANDNFGLIRYTSAGVLIRGQTAVTDFNGGVDLAEDVLIQPNGAIVLAGYATAQGGARFALARYTSGLSLDSTFSGDGRQQTPLGSHQSAVHGLALQSGSLVAAGYGYKTGTSDAEFALARYDSAGELDPAFGDGGVVLTPFLSDTDIAYDVAVQADGKIVVAGSVAGGSLRHFGVARYLPDGSLDPTFDGDGRAVTVFSVYGEEALGVAIQPNGKIVVAGRASNGTINRFALARYNANGSLDTNFNGDGRLTTTFVNNESVVAMAVAILSDGRIVAGGYRSCGLFTCGFAAARYTSNGDPDNMFSGNGQLTTGDSLDLGRDLAVQADGKLVMAGWGNGVFKLVRLTTSGGTDSTFSGDGVQTTDFGAPSEGANGVVIQSNGRIVAAGFAGDHVALARYTTGGALDTSFSGDGKVTGATGSFTDSAEELAIQDDGKLVVPGRHTPAGDDPRFVLWRLESGGTFDGTFSGDGRATLAFGTGPDIGRAAAIQDDGRLVVAGSAWTGANTDLALARFEGETIVTGANLGITMSDSPDPVTSAAPSHITSP